MGSWGVGPFENDSALDWAGQFDRAYVRPGWFPFRRFDKGNFVKRALRATRGKTGFQLDTWTCEKAVAAAEVVAALRGKPGQAYPAEIEKWLHAPTLQSSPGLVDDAIASVQRVRDDSELCDCWREAKDPANLEKWIATIDDLLARLRAA